MYTVQYTGTHSTSGYGNLKTASVKDAGGNYLSVEVKAEVEAEVEAEAEVEFSISDE